MPGGLRLPEGVKTHSLKSMNAPFASGSNPPDAMVVIPCTMGTLGDRARLQRGRFASRRRRGAEGERKPILVPRETPLSLVHVKNMELLLLPARRSCRRIPSFYAGPKRQEVGDTVVARVLDHLGVPQQIVPRWAKKKNKRMNMDQPNASCAATSDFELRREAKRHAAFGLQSRLPYGSGVAAALQSSLRFASASCHRSPNLCHPCAKSQDCMMDSAETHGTN